jgi:hypothetical protein
MQINNPFFAIIAAVLVLLTSVFSCVKPPQFPVEPRITYVGVDNPQVFQGSATAPSDTLSIRFSFTDGDGDLSLADDSVDIFLVDSRVPQFPITYRIPSINPEGASNGIEGDIWVNIPNKPLNICCYINGQACAASQTQAVDTFSYSIQIRDRAGNLSNIIRTEKITVLCL